MRGQTSVSLHVCILFLGNFTSFPEFQISLALSPHIAASYSLERIINFFQDKQKFLVCQKQMLSDLRVAVATFSAQNPSVNMEDFLSQIQDTEHKIDELLKG